MEVLKIDTQKRDICTHGQRQRQSKDKDKDKIKDKGKIE
jgi:hypothetical protein